MDFDDYSETNNRLDLLGALHDANPEFRCTLFAVPGLGSEAFWDSTPEWCELAVHGWMHPDPYEAANWTRDEALDVLLAAPARFVDGWKSPGWQISDGTYQAVQDLGWWCADHYENNDRRPDGLRTHVLGQGDHWHGHIQNVCGNGLAETFPEVLARVEAAESFAFVSEVVAPWHAGVTA